MMRTYQKELDNTEFLQSVDDEVNDVEQNPNNRTFFSKNQKQNKGKSKWGDFDNFDVQLRSDLGQFRDQQTRSSFKRPYAPDTDDEGSSTTTSKSNEHLHDDPSEDSTIPIVQPKIDEPPEDEPRVEPTALGHISFLNRITSHRKSLLNPLPLNPGTRNNHRITQIRKRPQMTAFSSGGSKRPRMTVFDTDGLLPTTHMMADEEQQRTTNFYDNDFKSHRDMPAFKVQDMMSRIPVRPQNTSGIQENIKRTLENTERGAMGSTDVIEDGDNPSGDMVSKLYEYFSTDDISDQVMPSEIEQLRGDVEFDTFSLVQDGF